LKAAIFKEPQSLARARPR
jgi:hypothetical protein